MPRTSYDAPLMIGTSAIEMRPRRAVRGEYGHSTELLPH